MAGQPKRRALADELQRRTLEYFDIDLVDAAINPASIPSHLDYVAAIVECGTSTTKQAADLSDTLGFPVSYERLMAYLREEYGRQETDASLKDARSRASHCLAESAQEIVDEPAYDSVSVQRARNRAGTRQWLAERYNQAQYGSQKGVSVNVSVSSLHLSALQSSTLQVTSGAERQQTAAIGPANTAVQVIEAPNDRS